MPILSLKHFEERHCIFCNSESYCTCKYWFRTSFE